MPVETVWVDLVDQSNLNSNILDVRLGELHNKLDKINKLILQFDNALLVCTICSGTVSEAANVYSPCIDKHCYVH